MSIGTLRKVTPKFDTEFERWVSRTKTVNGFPKYTDSRGLHNKTRRELMDLLADTISKAPPIRFKRMPKKSIMRGIRII